MSSTGLFDALGWDPADATVQAARSDAEDYERLIDGLVTTRSRLGLSQRAVAERMGTTQSAISDLERLGGSAQLATLQRFARAVGGHISTRFVVDEWTSTMSAHAGVAEHARDTSNQDVTDQVVIYPTFERAV